MSSSVYKVVLIGGAISLLMALAIVTLKGSEAAAPFIVLCFIALAIGLRHFPLLRGYSYTVTIFGAVAAALYYPEYFTQVGDFRFAVLITPLIQLIMFGMGTSMGIKDFAAVVKNPRGVFIGLFSHYMIMPALGFGLASVSGLSPEIAAGIILIGCSPGGTASNVISYLAKANLALSITVTACSTLLAPVVTPVLMKFLAGALIEIDVWDMMWDISKMVIMPIGAGIAFNRLFHGRVKWLDNAMPLVSMFGIAFIVIIVTAAGRDHLLNIGFLLVLIVLIHNLAGYALGYWTGRLFRMNERDCRTIAIEVGMQNGGLASGLAKEMGKIATVGLAPVVFSSVMNISGSLLASYWQRKRVKKTKAYNEQEDATIIPQVVKSSR